MVRRIIASLVVLLVTAGAWGQPLADRVPASAVVYFGWAGTESLQDAYSQSRLKQVLASSAFPQLLDETMDALIKKVGEDDPAVGEFAKGIQELLTIAAKHPSAVCIGGFDFEHGVPRARISLLCRAGADSDKVQSLLESLTSDSAIPVKLIREEDLVLVHFNTPPAADGETLAASDGFKAALAQVQQSPAVIVYIDVQNALGEYRRAFAAQMERDENFPAAWADFPGHLGLDGLKRAVWTANFDGQDWASAAFIEAPAPRKGIVSLLDARPVSPEMLAAIPADATVASVGRFDIAKLVTEVRSAIDKTDPEARKVVNQGFGAVQMFLGLNPVSGLLEPMGDEWTVYSSPTIGGDGLLGYVAINRLDDVRKAERGLTTLAIAINNVLAGQLRRSKIELSVRQAKVGDITLNYVATPVVSPTWAVKDGLLYMGLYPQVVVGAIDAARAGPERALATNEAFRAARARLGSIDETTITAFSFTNLPQTLDGTYGINMLLARTVTGFADLFGLKAPEMVMPPPTDLRPHLAPIASVTWADDAGWHHRRIEPFPLSGMFTNGFEALVTHYKLFGTITGAPLLAKSRADAMRAQSQSNLRQIGQAVIIYANENRGRFPETLADASTSVGGRIWMARLVTPSVSGKTVPGDFDTWAEDKQKAWINENAAYAYLGGQMRMQGMNQAWERILAYEKPDVIKAGRLNLLFADGHVESHDRETAMRRVAEQEADQN